MAASPPSAAAPLTAPAVGEQLSRVPYLPGLDGLRAVAVAAVMVYHANSTWLSGGFLGVEVFFVISGYLITLLLIAEKERTGQVRLTQFWFRRARRLLPALFLMMGGLVVYMALFERRPMGQTRGDLLAGTFYVSNWFQVWVGHSYTAAEAFAPLRHLWSLAVEEQFYLLWPLIMLLILRYRSDRLPRVAMWLVAISVGLAAMVGAMYISGTVYIGADAVTGALSCQPGESHGFLKVFGRCINVNETMYVGTVTRAGGLMLGAAMAMVWRPVAIMRGRLRRRGRTIDLLALGSLVGLAWLMSTLWLLDKRDLSYNEWLFRGGFLATGLFSLGLIAAATHRRSLVGRLMGIAPLRWVGQRSYGLYLYHWPIYQILRDPGKPLHLGQFALAMLITVPITELSYRLVELPIRTGKLSKFLAAQRSAPTPEARQRRRRVFVIASALAVVTGFATVSVATADVVCVTQVECDSEQGREAIAAGIASSVPVSLSNTSTSVAVVSHLPVIEGPTDPPTLPPTTVDPIDLIPTQAFGESVMLGAVGELSAGGIVVDAAVSRQGTNMAELLERLRAEGQLGRVVIIQTGTNGYVNDANFDRIMAQLPAELTPMVVFLTVRAPRDWIAPNNRRIRDLPTRYPNVVILDWEAASEAILDQLSGDGYHLKTGAAKQFYANLIFDAIGRPDLKK
ncbi:MAG: acyltransferase [Actinomycetia bacterium]|nr:acyltransferase [Actinomycetes bacterium]